MSTNRPVIKLKVFDNFITIICTGNYSKFKIFRNFNMMVGIDWIT